MVKFYIKDFYVVVKALSGKLKLCMQTGLVSVIITPMTYWHTGIVYNFGHAEGNRVKKRLHFCRVVLS